MQAYRYKGIYRFICVLTFIFSNSDVVTIYIFVHLYACMHACMYVCRYKLGAGGFRELAVALVWVVTHPNYVPKPAKFQLNLLPYKLVDL